MLCNQQFSEAFPTVAIEKEDTARVTRSNLNHNG